MFKTALLKKLKYSKRFKISKKNYKNYGIIRKHDQKIIFLKKPQKLKNFLKTFFYLSLFGSTFYLLGSNSKSGKTFQYYITLPVRKYIGTLLSSNELKDGGVDLVNKIFNEQSTNEAVLECLINVLNDELFLKQSTIFGINLLEKVINDLEFIDQAKVLVNRILLSEEVQKESVELLNYLVQQEESKDILAQFFKVIFLREDILQSLSNLFTEGAVTAIEEPITKKHFGEFVGNVWADPKLRWSLFKKSFDFWSSHESNLTVDKGKEEADKILKEMKMEEIRNITKDYK